ncbi:hypothetical protein O181_026437 [Austropuccinia psidii MF-1]|uniref:Reverse transcriptase domain-containing protein n=1 Tax=Austropuccinia psidii MF-1 TaxID=1389203 RepID=A0A9Q3CQK5_9BASI|nr:hypothetical protein [Austropuccinia psidii MF-1]
MNQLLTVLNGSSIFSRIDFHDAYNLLRLKECDEHLTALRTTYFSYESLGMPFGLTNAPASFQNLFNDIMSYLLDAYVVIYLDYIMVFTKSEEEHVTHLSTVLSRLRANNHFAKAFKCLFHISSVEYFGYVVSSEALRWTKQKSSKLSTGVLQETSRIFNDSLVLQSSTAISSRIIQRLLVHSQSS